MLHTGQFEQTELLEKLFAEEQSTLRSLLGTLFFYKNKFYRTNQAGESPKHK